MAAAVKNVVFFFLTVTSLMSSYSARESPEFNQLLLNSTAPPPAGSSGGGGVLDCLTSLYRIKACSGEIVAYFSTGAIDITPPCCEAIAVITHQCWPSVLTALGFSPDETYILRGYCDALSAAAYATRSTDSGPGPVGPAMSPMGPAASPLAHPLSPEN